MISLKIRLYFLVNINLTLQQNVGPKKFNLHDQLDSWSLKSTIYIISYFIAMRQCGSYLVTVFVKSYNSSNIHHCFQCIHIK